MCVIVWFRLEIVRMGGLLLVVVVVGMVFGCGWVVGKGGNLLVGMGCRDFRGDIMLYCKVKLVVFVELCVIGYILYCRNGCVG